MAFQEILLHIGMPKSGSTSIQRALGEAAVELRKHGIIYPRFPSVHLGEVLDNHTYPVWYKVGFKRENFFGDPAKFIDASGCQDVWDELSLIDGKKLILIGAGLCHMSELHVKRLSEFLNSLLTSEGHLRILLVMREPSARVASVRNQLRKEYLRIGPLEVSQDAAGFGKNKTQKIRIQKWQEHFPAASIELVRFEEMIAQGGPAFAIAQWADLPLELADTRENESLSYEAETLLNRLHGRGVRMKVVNFVGLKGTQNLLLPGEQDSDLQEAIDRSERDFEFAGLPAYSKKDFGFLDLTTSTLWSVDTLVDLKQQISKENRLTQIWAYSEILNLSRDKETGYHQAVKKRMLIFALRELVKLKPRLALKFLISSKISLDVKPSSVLGSR
ncbi:MAG: hypothetical protein ACPGYK_06580 [Flavobacteriales bacterium]